eukprot:s3098_g11.t1
MVAGVRRQWPGSDTIIAEVRVTCVKKEGRIVTFRDTCSGVQDCRLDCVDDVTRLQTFRDEKWEVEGAWPGNIGMIFARSLGPMRVSRKLKNHESRRQPQRMYRRLCMPVVNEILGMQLVPCRQRKGNRLITGAAVGLDRPLIRLEPACTPIPCQCLGTEPAYYVM